MKKITMLSVVMVIIFTMFYTWKSGKDEEFLILDALAGVSYDPLLWHASVVKVEKMEKEKKIFENDYCQKALVRVELQLKEDCWVNEKDENPLEKNFLMKSILDFYNRQDIASEENLKIHSLNRCMSESIIIRNLKEIEEEEMKTVGEEECLSYNNFIFGGECTNKKIKTKESVIEKMAELKSEIKLELELEKNTIIKKGTKSELEETIETCKGANGSKKINIIKI